MGKPTSSCFKILTCGAAEDAEDDVGVADPEKTSLSDKRRWSFRNRSSGHRGLSNSVISEPLSVNSSKEVQEATVTNCYSPISSSIPEKTYVQKPEKTYSQEPKKAYIQEPKEPRQQECFNEADSTSEDLVGAGQAVTEKNRTANDDVLSGTVAVVNQAAAMGYTAHSEFEKLQYLIKLQAAVRGHLVRRQAVGTLRCIHAIIKMQMLVRAPYALKSVEVPFKNGNGKQWARSINQKETFAARKLLLNGFARQLLESTPKIKSINIKCDPSKPDPASLWLERWMAVLSRNVQTVQEDASLEQVEELIQSTLEAPNDSSDQIVSSTINRGHADSAKTAEGGGGLTPKSIGACGMKGSLNIDDGGQSLPRNIPVMKECDSENVLEGTADSLTVQTLLESGLTSRSVHIAEKPECDRSPKHSDKRITNELSDTERKKFSIASRKAGNPAFVAAQSKFEELSSAEVAGKSSKHTHRDALKGSEVDKMLKKADSSLNANNRQLDSSSETHDLSLGGSHHQRVQMGTSEFATEISISSTLDSPDRSESEGREVVLENGSLEKGKNHDNSHANVTINLHNGNSESKDILLEPEVGLEKVGCSTLNLIQEASDGIALVPSGHMGKPKDPQLHNSSPDAFSGSHVTAPESQGTSSRQIFINGNKNKKKNGIPAQKQKSQVVVKRSPLNPNNDSGGSSTEHLPDDTKSTKRRSSFGITKSNQVDHEPRTSTSSSLPSYMQATESARAKIHVGVSPKESPEVCDKDNDLKKRHSLPIAIVKQGLSPRMQRSCSQAQQNSKGNGVHSPQTSDRRWQR